MDSFGLVPLTKMSLRYKNRKPEGDEEEKYHHGTGGYEPSLARSKERQRLGKDARLAVIAWMRNETRS